MPEGTSSASAVPTLEPAIQRPPAPEAGTVLRVLMLLSCIADHPGETANALARRLNLPRSTTHRLLKTLCTYGFSQQQADGSFSPGSELYRISGRLNADIPYARLAMPLLQRLSSEFRETSVLTLLARQQLKMFFSATSSPPDPMRYNIGLNRLESLAWGSTGRSLLAYLSDEEVQAVIATDDRSPFNNRALDRNELMAALAEIREKGYAVTVAHRTPNAVGVAVPFFDGGGAVVGNFSLMIPDSRYSPAMLGPAVHALQDAARSMSNQLGFREMD